MQQFGQNTKSRLTHLGLPQHSSGRDVAYRSRLAQRTAAAAAFSFTRAVEMSHALPSIKAAGVCISLAAR